MSKNLKTECLAWLRFGKQYHYVSTEVGHYSADIAASNGSTTLIEIEIKVSKSDFKRDFTHKDKHTVYANPTEKNVWVPHKMYFAVPEHLKDFALAELESKNPNYGLLICREDSYYPTGKRICCAKKAKQLHNNPLKSNILETFVARMSSEIVNWHQTADNYPTIHDFVVRAQNITCVKDIEVETK